MEEDPWHVDGGGRLPSRQAGGLDDCSMAFISELVPQEDPTPQEGLGVIAAVSPPVKGYGWLGPARRPRRMTLRSSSSSRGRPRRWTS